LSQALCSAPEIDERYSGGIIVDHIGQVMIIESQQTDLRLIWKDLMKRNSQILRVLRFLNVYALSLKTFYLSDRKTL
jgi:hypothetical protein